MVYKTNHKELQATDLGEPFRKYYERNTDTPKEKTITIPVISTEEPAPMIAKVKVLTEEEPAPPVGTH